VEHGEREAVRVVVIEEANNDFAHKLCEKLLLQVERSQRLQRELDRRRLVGIDL
jgi:hypothetical protein